MTIVSVIIALISFVLGWILFAGLILYIDTGTQQYYMQLKGLVAAHVVPTKDFLLIKLKVPFYTFTFDPLKISKPSKKPKKEPKSKSGSKRRKGKSWPVTLTLVKSLFATFRVKHFRLDLDTGNYPLNARLVPIFTLMSRGPATLKTNFTGKSYFSMEMENRLIRMVKPAFKYLISK